MAFYLAFHPAIQLSVPRSWVPAVPTVIKSLQKRSGNIQCDQKLAVGVQEKEKEKEKEEAGRALPQKTKQKNLLAEYRRLRLFDQNMKSLA